MTIEELLARESIRKTMASYTFAGDRLRAEDFMAAFTEDGILESEGVPAADAFRYEGRDAMRQWFSRWRQAPSDAQRPKATFVRHHLSTSHIGPDHCGYYVDSLRKVGESWLIAHRKVRLDWRSPQSLFTTVIAQSR
jgi:SnoaL-like domain